MVYGFIGLGNMAGAIIRGMAGSGSFSSDTLCGFNRSPEKTQRLAQETGLVPCESARQVAEQADVLVLGVKPQMLPDVLPLIAPAVTPKTLVVTIAAGKGFDFYASYLGDVPLVRVMPNICAQVLCSASAVCPNSLCSPAQAELVRAMFRTVGAVYDIPEAQFAAFSALGGASGAFVQMYIDALSSAGVKAGLPRALAQKIACQATLGAAKLCQETGEHPMALVDKVTSPGRHNHRGRPCAQKSGLRVRRHRSGKCRHRKGQTSWLKDHKAARRLRISAGGFCRKNADAPCASGVGQSCSFIRRDPPESHRAGTCLSWFRRARQNTRQSSACRAPEPEKPADLHALRSAGNRCFYGTKEKFLFARGCKLWG